MLEILPSPSHLAAYRFTGTLTADDYDRCIVDLETRLQQFARIGIYCDLGGFTGITPAAMARDLRYTLGKVGQFDRFARGAIVTDRHWLAAATDLAARLFPHTHIRSFGEKDAALAMDWAGAVDPQPVAATEG